MAEEKSIDSYKKELEDRMINDLFTYLREGTAPTKPKDLDNNMICHNIIYNLTNDNKGNILLEYHNEIITKAVTECYEKIKDLTDSEFLDSFILYTERLNCFIFVMSRIFIYLSTNYLKAAEDANNVRIFKQDNICEFSMDIYKTNFYDKLKEKIEGVLKGDNINEEKKEKINNIIGYVELKKPKIIKTSSGNFAWTETEKNC